MSNTNAAPDCHMNDGFERWPRWQKNSPASQFFHDHIRQYIGLAQGLRGRCQPACECPHVRRHKRTHLHSVEKQGQMLAPRLWALEITIDLMVIDADLPRQKS